MSYKILRPIAILILFFFSWTFLGIYNLAYAIDKQLSQSSLNQPKEQRPEEGFEKSIKEVEDTINNLKKVKTHEELINEKDSLRAKRQEIETQDIEIRRQFQDTEKKLKDAGLSPEILDRHNKIVKHYEDNINELRRNLDDIEKAETKNEIDSVTEKIKTHLEKTRPPSKHIPLDPNKLPHRKAEPTKKKPRIKKEDFEKELG